MEKRYKLSASSHTSLIRNSHIKSTEKIFTETDSPKPAVAYSTAYPFALIAVILASKILTLL